MARCESMVFVCEDEVACMLAPRMLPLLTSRSTFQLTCLWLAKLACHFLTCMLCFCLSARESIIHSNWRSKRFAIRQRQLNLAGQVSEC